MIDSQIRQDIIDEFEFDPAFDGEHIGVAVDNNVVSLTGHVTSYDVRKLSGVRGVTNNISIKPRVEASNVKAKIELASKRHAEFEANAIRVTVENGNKIILDGKVDNWDKRRAAENTVWSAPGVAIVEDHLTNR
jgi:hyperosmotically inducible protein